MEPPRKAARTEGHPKRDLAAIEREEEENFNSGPFSVLASATKGKSQVLVVLRNDHKMIGRLVAFDRHFNMYLEDVYEVWAKTLSKEARAAGEEPETQTKRINKVFLRGDGVILVTKVEGQQ